MVRFIFLLTVVCIFASSCTTIQSSLPDDSRVVHVVVCWLKNPNDTGARKDLIETAKTFVQIPGVVDVRTGQVVESQRPVVDSSFDVAVSIYFENKQALLDYEKHPIHQKAVQEKLVPLVKKFVIYDFTAE